VDRVLLIERDASVRDLVAKSLGQAGFEVCLAEDAEHGWRSLLEHRPDALILDLLMPGRHALDLLRDVRADPATRAIPVMVLSGRDTEMDKLLCFDLGADDYLAKPFSTRELAARVRVMVRRSRPVEHDGTIRVGELEVYPLAREAMCAGRAMILTPREFELLLFLARNPGRAMSRGELLRNVWGGDFEGDSRTVDVHVRRLRHKMGELHSAIETVTGTGYKLVKSRPGAD
jgi:DNA-binding response OmpR family regulator